VARTKARSLMPRWWTRRSKQDYPTRVGAARRSWISFSRLLVRRELIRHNMNMTQNPLAGAPTSSSALGARISKAGEDTGAPTSKLSQRDNLTIARRFNAGIGSVCIPSPAGTAESSRSLRPSLRDLIPFASQPGVETPGYYRLSRWDATSRHSLFGVPALAGPAGVVGCSRDRLKPGLQASVPGGR